MRTDNFEDEAQRILITAEKSDTKPSEREEPEDLPSTLNTWNLVEREKPASTIFSSSYTLGSGRFFYFSTERGEKMINPETLKFVKKICVHEAGHAIVALSFGAPIHFVELEIKIDGREIFVSGMVEHDMKIFIEDSDGEEGVKFRSYQGFTEYLTIMWGGMAAESICYPGAIVTLGAKGDLEKINGMLYLLPEQFKAQEKLYIAQTVAILAKETIQKNRPGLEKLAGKLFSSLLINNMSIKIEGSKLMETFSVEKAKGAECRDF